MRMGIDALALSERWRWRYCQDYLPRLDHDSDVVGIEHKLCSGLADGSRHFACG